MPDLKPTALPALTSLAGGDIVTVVDVSDTTDDAAGSDKQMTATNLAAGIASIGSLATDAEVTTAVSTHAGAVDPHGDRAHASGLIATHEAASDPHPGYTTTAELATHAGLTSSVHGISAFGASLVDDANAAAARTTLGLGGAATLAVGTTAGTVAAGDDSRLSDARTPTAHASSHADGGSDEIAVDASQITSGTVATARLASGSASASTFLRGDQTWATPAGGGSSGTLSQRGQMAAYDATSSFYGVPSFIITTANTTLTLVADTLYYFLFFVDSDITINTAVLEVTNNIGTTIRHGIVRLDATDRQPNSTGLVWQTTVSSATTGLRSSTGLSVALTAGIYATLLVCDGAAGIRRARGALASTMFRFNATNAAVALTSKPSVGTSAFSDPVPDWTALTVADIVDQPVGYRWS